MKQEDFFWCHRDPGSTLLGANQYVSINLAADLSGWYAGIADDHLYNDTSLHFFIGTENTRKYISPQPLAVLSTS